MSERVTVSEGARRIGCNEKQIRRGVEKGRLHKDSDGLVDMEELRGPWRKIYNKRVPTVSEPGSDNAQLSEQSVRTRARRSDTAAPSVQRRADGAPDLNDEDTLRNLDAFVERLLDGRYASQTEAITVKENALALKHVLAARKEAGRLVELEVAEAVLFEEARAARDAWISWPAKVGTLIAANLGVDADKVINELAEAVHKQLEDLGQPDPDFLAAQAEAEA